MEIKKILLGVVTVICLTFSSCKKYAEKIADTYTGTMRINDVDISGSFNVEIEDISKNVVAISSTEFETFELKISKQRYFASVTYYSNEGDNNLEVWEDGNISLYHIDQDGEVISFVGSSSN